MPSTTVTVSGEGRVQPVQWHRYHGADSKGARLAVCEQCKCSFATRVRLFHSIFCTSVGLDFCLCVGICLGFCRFRECHCHQRAVTDEADRVVVIQYGCTRPANLRQGQWDYQIPVDSVNVPRQWRVPAGAGATKAKGREPSHKRMKDYKKSNRCLTKI